MVHKRVHRTDDGECAGGFKMPVKRATRKKSVQVNFELPGAVGGDSVALCGEFNEWSSEATPMGLGEDGCWRATVALEPGRSYRFRYLIDGERWENDWQAATYLPNPFGDDDSVVEVA